MPLSVATFSFIVVFSLLRFDIYQFVAKVADIGKIKMGFFYILVILSGLFVDTVDAGVVNTKQWCHVNGAYVVVDDDLFRYIAKFTHDKGRQHFLYTVAMVESGMNPYSSRGSSGEFGMMQVLPGTGAFVSRLNKKHFDVSKVEGNIYSSLSYLNFILSEIDKNCHRTLSLEETVALAAAAYNGGAGHLSKGCSLSSFNKKARSYSRKFMYFWQKSYVSEAYFNSSKICPISNVASAN
jgi:hypothetical protein